MSFLKVWRILPCHFLVIRFKVFIQISFQMTKRKTPIRFTGQHFTIDKNLISDTIKFANLQDSDIVLDIGAGKGFLTVHLLKHTNNLIAIEKDSDLALYLKQKFRQCPDLTIFNIDFLKFKLPSTPFKVVSNIPYSITSEILKVLMFDNVENFNGGSIVMQLAPAKKLVSDSFYNAYVVFYRTFFSLKLKYEINPSSFMPPPTVQSALLCIEPYTDNIIYFDKAKYLRFIQFFLKSPDSTFRKELKAIFRKSQIKSLCIRHSLDLEIPLNKVNPSIWKICYNEMIKMVPEKFHP